MAFGPRKVLLAPASASPHTSFVSWAGMGNIWATGTNASGCLRELVHHTCDSMARGEAFFYTPCLHLLSYKTKLSLPE